MKEIFGMRQRARNLVVAALILTLVAPMALHAGDLEGTYRLVKRALPDGTEQGRCGGPTA
jgi:hypothetical protein